MSLEESIEIPEESIEFPEESIQYNKLHLHELEIHEQLIMKVVVLVDIEEDKEGVVLGAIFVIV
jgi:hypothetical protein